MKISNLALLMIVASPTAVVAAGVTEFCLDGELDLGARYQGTKPRPGEYYPTTWCVITEDDTSRVLFSGAGKSNPDMDGDWAVAYLPPDTVRIVNRESPPDVEFQGTDNLQEALRVRRIDPRRLAEEYKSRPENLAALRVEIQQGRAVSVATSADLPLRGRVQVVWNWDWTNAAQPRLRVLLDNDTLFRATGRWRELTDDEVAAVWNTTPGPEPIEVPGDRWPARINMHLVELADGVYLVRGVRTGFQHLVVDTAEGLVVADAPAGWVEFHHLPPSELVPGLGISGLSEKLLDFLHEQFPERPVHSVVLSHFHDDHAGGARAFAAAGAKIYTTGESAAFFSTAMNLAAMPADRLTEREGSVTVIPVTESTTIGGAPQRVQVVPLGANPHAYAMLGVWALDGGYFFVSDVHVPRSDADTPREDRSATECWFAAWAVSNLPPDVRVVNSHSAQETPVSRLAKYLGSELCEGR